MFTQELINDLNAAGSTIFDLPYYGTFKGGKVKLNPRPKPGIWPPPVYEAHYVDGREIRYSFWSPKGKPIDTTSIRARMEERGRMCTGFVEYDGKRWVDGLDGPPKAKVNGKRITAKQAREGLGRLLACLDGTVTDHDEIRSVVIECRELAA